MDIKMKKTITDMKKRTGRRLAALLAGAAVISVLLAGCGKAAGTENEGTKAAGTDYSHSSQDTTGGGETSGSREDSAGTQPGPTNVPMVTVRTGSMKGPTTIGLLSLMQRAKLGETEGKYEFTIVTAADELLTLMVKGELDIALVPANVASVLYRKTEGGISVIDINTLGVLYMVSGDSSIKTMEDLKGRTVYLTGKGTTPDYVLKYLLEKNGIRETELVLEYKSEAAEVAAILAAQPEAVGLLPQPFVTAACAQNEALSVTLDMTEEWNRISPEGSSLVTGVTVVRREFLENNPEAVAGFMAEHKESTEYTNNNIEETAKLAVEAGIIAKEPLAQKAIPQCNVTYLDGAEMKAALEGYLKVLYGQNPESVGGKLPEEDFYYNAG